MMENSRENDKNTRAYKVEYKFILFFEIAKARRYYLQRANILLYLKVFIFERSRTQGSNDSKNVVFLRYDDLSPFFNSDERSKQTAIFIVII